MKTVAKSIFILYALLLMSAAMETGYRIPAQWPKPVYDYKRNTYQANKYLLGRVLFYDPILSKDGSISCASCHSPYNAFAHTDHALSHGIHDSIGTRNAPALMNLAWKKSYMWDGAINNLDAQALAPLTHAAEMGSTLEQVLEKLQQSPKYRKLFYAAWQDSMANTHNLLYAMSQFMLNMVSYRSRYDSVQSGLTRFSEQEQRGYTLFKQHCNRCHTEPLFTHDGFETNGLATDPVLADSGRFRITRRKADLWKFKVPSLRNVEYTAPYMHDGRMASLHTVLQHYAKGSVIEKNLDANEKTDLMAFLLCLSDRAFLFDETLSYPKQTMLSP